MPSNYLPLCHPLLLLASIFSSIRVFSNESAGEIRYHIEKLKFDVKLGNHLANFIDAENYVRITGTTDVKQTLLSQFSSSNAC